MKVLKMNESFSLRGAGTCALGKCSFDRTQEPRACLYFSFQLGLKENTALKIPVPDRPSHHRRPMERREPCSEPAPCRCCPQPGAPSCSLWSPTLLGSGLSLLKRSGSVPGDAGLSHTSLESAVAVTRPCGMLPNLAEFLHSETGSLWEG